MNDYHIGNVMEEMEKELIISMKQNLSRHLKEEDKMGFEFPQWQTEKLKELKRYQRENKTIIDNYTKGLDKDISEHLKKELTQGSIKSINQYNEVMGKNLKASKMLNHSFFKTNDRKINALIKVVNNDLKTVSTSALRMMNDEYRQVIHKSAFFLANGTISPQKAIDMATKDFLTRGLNCIEYKDGRRVNIASYSEMAVRTASLRAQLMGDGDFRQSIGRYLVIATTSNMACPKCSKWEEVVMIDDVYSKGSKKDGDYPLLSEAMKQDFLHPNCRDGVATYYPEVEDIHESYNNKKNRSESDEQYQKDLSYINQRIKQFERLALGSLDKENIKVYESKKSLYEKKKEEMLVVKEVLSYKDVTKEWLEDANPNSHKVLDRSYFEHNGVKYEVDNKNVVLDYSKKEKEVAEWLESTFGGELYMVPRINSPSGVQTPDYIFRGNKWDLKSITGNGKQVLYHSVYKKKEQSNNFIFDVSLSTLNMNEVIQQIEKLYKRKDISFINEIIVKKDNDFLIFKRK